MLLGFFLVALPALAGGGQAKRPALHETIHRHEVEKRKDALEEKQEQLDTGRDMGLQGIQKEVSARSQDVKSGTAIIKDVNKKRDGIVQKIR